MTGTKIDDHHPSPKQPQLNKSTISMLREVSAALLEFSVVLIGASLALISVLSILGAIGAVIIWPFGEMLAWGGVMFLASYPFIAAGLSLTTGSNLLRRILLTAVCYLVGSYVIIVGLRSDRLSTSFAGTIFSPIDFILGAVIEFGSGALLGLGFNVVSRAFNPETRQRILSHPPRPHQIFFSLAAYTLLIGIPSGLLLSVRFGVRFGLAVGILTGLGAGSMDLLRYFIAFIIGPPAADYYIITHDPSSVTDDHVSEPLSE